MIFLYLLSVLTILQGIYTLIEGIRAARYIRGYVSPKRSSGRTVVFCPCKGVDHEFEKNIRSILEQDFSNFEVWFILDSESDPAFAALKDIGGAHILIAGHSTDCGQKVHNLRYAVQNAGLEADTYVFCDSDARYPRNWLIELTAPLSDERTDVTTGYRWYAVQRFHLPTLLRSAWNSSSIGVLGNHGRNFAWGGSTAIRRSTFERIGVLDAWRGALSDDYAITRAAQSAGSSVRFVPSCLIPSHGQCGFKELLEFTTRQIIITRVYSPRLWTVGLISQSVFNLTFWLLLVGALRMDSGIWIFCWILLYALSATRSAVRFFAVKARLGNQLELGFSAFYILASPLIALLYQYNLLTAAFTNSIVWRQIHYSLISPNETHVRRSAVNAD